MKVIISISLEDDQANAVKLLKEATRAKSASDLIRKALHHYALEHSPTLAPCFNRGDTRRSLRYSGDGTPAHPKRPHPKRRPLPPPPRSAG